MLSGYKTYILGGVTILGYVAAYLVGDASLTDTINMVVTAGLGIFIRNGIATSVAKAVAPAAVAAPAPAAAPAAATK